MTDNADLLRRAADRLDELVGAINPKVGKGLPAWLRVAAKWQTTCTPPCPPGLGCPDCDLYAAALTVARAILEETT